jgi:hypothetical protein
MESEHKFMLNDILRKKRKSKMRKPECLVFLTYGPIHVSPLGWIKRWKEDIICICQRLRYGYCYRDAWASGFLLSSPTCSTIYVSTVMDIRDLSQEPKKRMCGNGTGSWNIWNFYFGRQTRKPVTGKIHMKKHMIRQEKLSPGNTGCLVKS